MLRNQNVKIIRIELSVNEIAKEQYGKLDLQSNILWHRIAIKTW